MNGRGQIELKMDMWLREHVYVYNQRFWGGKILSIKAKTDSMG